MSVIPLPSWPAPRGGRLGTRSLMEERVTLLSIAGLSAWAVSTHQLSSCEDASCSRASSSCYSLLYVGEGFASWTAWASMAAPSPARVLSAQVLSTSVDA